MSARQRFNERAPELVSASVIARRFGVSRTLPYVWADRGFIDEVHIPSTGGRRPHLVRFTRESVEKFAASFTRYEHRNSGAA